MWGFLYTVVACGQQLYSISICETNPEMNHYFLYIKTQVYDEIGHGEDEAWLQKLTRRTISIKS